MKVRAVAAFLCAMSLHSFAAEKKAESYLKFRLDEHNRIIKASHHGDMRFFCSEKDFLGKIISHAVPLEQPDRDKVDNALKLVRESSKDAEECVVYGLGNEDFQALITYKAAKNRVSVKVKELKSAEQA